MTDDWNLIKIIKTLIRKTPNTQKKFTMNIGISKIN